MAADDSHSELPPKPAPPRNARPEGPPTVTEAVPAASASSLSRSPSEDEAFPPGTVLAGRYRIVELLGRGGMGVVYRAEDLKLDETVALKFLPADVGRDPRRLSRLLNEVRTARQVSHPNVCRVYDVGEADGRHFLTMEFIEGEDLAARIRGGDRLPKDEAASIARQLCLGLAAAHERGVLHRDLKPSNVMLDRRGVARITDFGLAEVAATFDGARAREGTPSYMAPEALAGSEVTLRSDLYALGLVLYELLTGRAAHPGPTAHDLLEQRRTPPPSRMPRDVDPKAARLILRCLEPDPARRPASARAVAAALPGGGAFAAAAAAAQQRADRITAFRAELDDLRRGGVLELDEPRLAALRKHHQGVLADLVEHFDVDVDERAKHLSLGMKVASLIGALALGASGFFFFYRIWGLISLPIQVLILVAVPAAALLATAILAVRDRSGYFTSIAAFAAFAGLVLDTAVLSQALGVAGSPVSFLIWGLFGMVLAYGYGLRLLLVSGAVCLAVFLASSIAHLAGAHYLYAFFRWEGFLPAGVLLLVLHRIASGRLHPEFAPVYRLLGLFFVFAPLFLLSNAWQPSYLPFGAEPVAVGYEIAGFGASALAVWIGIARRLKETVYAGGVSFTVFLYMKFVHWWWDWMPRYLFFLIVALTAIAALWVLRRLRAVLAGLQEGEAP